MNDTFGDASGEGPGIARDDLSNPDLEADRESTMDLPDDSSSLSFRDLGLSESTLQVLNRLDFQTPTPIQAQAIPLLLAGHDLVGIAQTGTGKTAAFALPMLELFDQQPQPAAKVDAALPVRGLVLAPTRELALQTSATIESFSADWAAAHEGAQRVVTVYGGAPYGPQLRALRAGTEIVVGTPGRLIDLLGRGTLDLSAVEMVVLDEADEMLKMGFTEDVETILQAAPPTRLTALFSATMPAAIEKVARKYLTEPRQVAVSAPSTTVDTIRQMYAVVPARFRFEALCRVLWTARWQAAIVFVKTRQDAEELAIRLSGRGIMAAGISGDVAQRDRERLIQSLREGSLDVLVATDVAARGIDVDRVELVVNYEAPREAESYVHRIGRTGRAGRQGMALTLFTADERHRLRRIERLTGTRMEQVDVPTSLDLLRERASRVLDSLPHVQDQSALEALRDSVIARQTSVAADSPLDSAEATADFPEAARELPQPELLEDLAEDSAAESAEPVDWKQLALRALWAMSLQGAGTEQQMRQADEAFAQASFPVGQRGRRGADGKRDKSNKRGESGQSVRYRIEVGRSHGANPRTIVGTIAGEAGIPGSDIGHIKLFPAFSLVDIDYPLTDEQMRVLSRATVRGRKLRIASDEGPKILRQNTEKPRRDKWRRGHHSKRKNK